MWIPIKIFIHPSSSILNISLLSSFPPTTSSCILTSSSTLSEDPSSKSESINFLLNPVTTFSTPASRSASVKSPPHSCCRASSLAALPAQFHNSICASNLFRPSPPVAAGIHSSTPALTQSSTSGSSFFRKIWPRSGSCVFPGNEG